MCRSAVAHAGATLHIKLNLQYLLMLRQILSAPKLRQNTPIRVLYFYIVIDELRASNAVRLVGRDDSARHEMFANEKYKLYL